MSLLDTAGSPAVPHRPGRCAGVRALRAAALIASSIAAAAHAEPVRKCIVDGRLVFQSAPCAQAAVRSGNVLAIGGTGAAAPIAAAEAGAPAALVAANETALPAKKKTLAEILRDRDGADRPRPTEAVGDGANVLRARMGAL